MGNGLTVAQMDNTSTTGYLDLIDIPEVGLRNGIKGNGSVDPVEQARERVICSGLADSLVTVEV